MTINLHLIMYFFGVLYAKDPREIVFIFKPLLFDF